MISLQDIRQAQGRIQPYIFRTPLRYSYLLSERTGAQVYLKLENWQVTGSFKPRGALNRMTLLDAAERTRGVVTASAGNHALGVGFAARALGVSPATIFVPQTVPRAKLHKLAEFPVEVRLAGETYDDAHHAAEAYQHQTGATFIHAYDDWRTVAGQGTMGLEILQDLPDVEVILVPVGGGGMIAGVALAVKPLSPACKIIAVQPAASPALRDSLRDGTCYQEYAAGPTLCDGLAGGIGTICYEVAHDLKWVDDVLIVEEEHVRGAIATLIETQQLIVEGSAAVGIAALLAHGAALRGKRVAVILSGGNIDIQRLRSLI